jgi:N-acetylglucosaminyl-diphospho-decaprenol L-rhamnosyltransferase
LEKIVHISIVSHGQGALVEQLLNDIKLVCNSDNLNVTLTLNIPEILSFCPELFPFTLRIVRNYAPKGFGANHNAAFRNFQNNSLYFCVLNPDIRLYENPFTPLFKDLGKVNVGLVAPLVVDGSGKLEDSARTFPTPFKVFCKAIGRSKGADYHIENELIYPDWVAGMFMLFSANVYAKFTGFNEKFFLYYEDVELCARLTLDEYVVVLNPAVRVTHLAQRNSHKSFKYFKWHLVSMLKFFCSKEYRLLAFK